MKKYKITTSLLNSFFYYLDVSMDEELKEETIVRAHQDFLNTLNCLPVEDTNGYLQRGREFEDACYNYDENNKEEAVKEIHNIIDKGVFQYKNKKDLECYSDNEKYTFSIVGVLDALKASHIYDIKRVNTYKLGKYKDSVQHILYFYLFPNTIDFTYLCVDNNLTLHKEKYSKCSDAEIKNTIINYIQQFFYFLKHENLLDIYLEKWKVKE